jgi:hypothetical protein
MQFIPEEQSGHGVGPSCLGNVFRIKEAMGKWRELLCVYGLRKNI